MPQGPASLPSDQDEPVYETRQTDLSRAYDKMHDAQIASNARIEGLLARLYDRTPHPAWTHALAVSVVGGAVTCFILLVLALTNLNGGDVEAIGRATHLVAPPTVTTTTVTEMTTPTTETTPGEK